MTRAVAEKGAELIQGVHKSQAGPVITIKQANGIIREVPFDEKDGATPILIDAMILELEIEDAALRETTKRYSLDFLDGWREVVGDKEAYETMPLDELYTKAESFIDGYKAALKKLQPYWRNPLPGN
jgi:hypothetical protein